jgi:hypothetical protein
VANRPRELAAHNVAQMAWAFATRKVYSEQLYDALAARAVELARSSGLEPRQISVIAHSFAKQAHK